MHLAEILGIYISYSNNIAVVLSIRTIYRFDGSGNEIKLAKLPVLQLMFPLAFLLYLHSFNLFYRRAIKREWRCFHSCCKRENAPQEAATAPPSRSHHVTAPSITFFDVPLTGAFTDVTTDHEECFYTMVVMVQNMAV